MKTTSKKNEKNEDDLKKNKDNLNKKSIMKTTSKNEDDLKKNKKKIGCDIIVN